METGFSAINRGPALCTTGTGACFSTSPRRRPCCRLGGLVLLAGLCVFVIVIGVVAFFVIRAVRKNRVAKENAAKETAPQEPKENS